MPSPVPLLPQTPYNGAFPYTPAPPAPVAAPETPKLGAWPNTPAPLLLFAVPTTPYFGPPNPKVEVALPTSPLNFPVPATPTADVLNRVAFPEIAAPGAAVSTSNWAPGLVVPSPTLPPGPFSKKPELPRVVLLVQIGM